MGNDLVRNGYNRIAERYRSQRDQFNNRRYLDKMVDLLKPGSSVLDIGCGSGVPVDEYFVHRGYRVIGFDIAERQVELAIASVPQAQYAVKDMSTMEAGEYQVDAVVSFYAIFHVPREQHQDLFKKLHSFLPDSGLILVTMGSKEWEGTEEDFHGAKMWWSHYGSEKNRKIVEDSGFEILLDEIDDSAGERHQVILARKR